jgi:hypothetical protein
MQTINSPIKGKKGFMPIDFAMLGIESNSIITKMQSDRIDKAYNGKRNIFLPDNIGTFSLNFSIPFIFIIPAIFPVTTVTGNILFK